MGESVELQIRHSDSESRQSDIQIVSRERDGVHLQVHAPGRPLGQPSVASIDYRVGSLAGDNPVAVVEQRWWGLRTSLDVIANLAAAIPGRATKRVRVVSGGLAHTTEVSDADTGERLVCIGVRVQIEGGFTPVVWVDPYPEASQLNATSEADRRNGRLKLVPKE